MVEDADRVVGYDSLRGRHPGASLVPAPEDIIAVVAERYGLRRVVLRNRLAGGYANDLYLLDSDRGRLVIRVVRRPVHVLGLDWETRAIASLARAVPEVVAPLTAGDGALFFAHGDDAVVVLPYVDGTPADRSDPVHRAEAAALLARLHAAGRELALEQRPGATRYVELGAALADGSYFAAIGPTARELPRELDRRSGEIEAARGWAVEFVEDVAQRRELQEGLVHGDYFRGNVLFRDDRAVGLVDFEETRLDWTAGDLANAVWEFCKADDYTTFDRAQAEEFVASYRAAGGTVPPEEDDLLVPLIRVRRILEVVRAPYDRDVDWEYQRRNLDAFHALA